MINNLVKQIDSDADIFIVEPTMEQFNRTNATIVIDEDVNLLILLTARTPTDKIIYFLKPGKLNNK